MSFKDQLIMRLKDDPDVFNELRSEIIVSHFDQKNQKEIDFIHKPDQSSFLENREDKEIIEAIFATLKYFIEYEKEFEERGV